MTGAKKKTISSRRWGGSLRALEKPGSMYNPAARGFIKGKKTGKIRARRPHEVKAIHWCSGVWAGSAKKGKGKTPLKYAVGKNNIHRGGRNVTRRLYGVLKKGEREFRIESI